MLTKQRVAELMHRKGLRFRVTLTQGRMFCGELFDVQITDGPTTFMFRDVELISPIARASRPETFMLASENELTDFEVSVA